MLPIRFKPFIGKRYEEQDFKILILGESHYFGEKGFSAYLNNEEIIETATIEVVNRFLNYKKNVQPSEPWMKTYTTFSNVFNGKKISNEETIDFWEKCSFYNYVQAPTKGPRMSPSNKEFNSSFDAFKKVVEDIKPNLIFFWGKRLWNKFPKETYSIMEKNGHKINFLNLSFDIPLLVVPHPSSSGFGYKNHDEIQNYLKLIKS